MQATVRFDIVIDSDWSETITCSARASAAGGGSVDLKWETVQRKFKRCYREYRGRSAHLSRPT